MRIPAALSLALLACSGGGASAPDAGTGGVTAADARSSGDAVAGGTIGSGGTDGTGGFPPPGCGTDADCPARSRCDVAEIGAPGTCRPSCTEDFECGDSARCQLDAGFCEPLPPCGVGGTCAAGSVCTCHGVCEPASGAACHTDLQCAVAEYCDGCSGTCTPRIPPCGRCADTSAACERRNDACVSVGREGLPHCLRGCAGQATCDALGAGYTCRDVGSGEMACVPPGGECSAAAPCQNDSACPPAHFCNAVGACQAGCTGDVACPEGTLCMGLRCLPACGPSSPCGEPAQCQPDGRCAVPGGCLSSADCPDRETHCDVATHLCAPGCQVDNDCLSAADACVDGRCQPRGCTGNYQCAFGEICDLPTGLCQPAGGHHCETPCDPADESACGGGGNRCLSLQDQDGNALGDFCYEVCQPAPNECPQGYQCVAIDTQGGQGSDMTPAPPPDHLCFRRCDQEPVQ